MADPLKMGFAMPVGDDYIRNGDDAISTNARVAADHIERLDRADTKTNEELNTAASRVDALEEELNAAASRVAALESPRSLIYGSTFEPAPYAPDADTAAAWAFEQTLGDVAGKWVLRQYSTFGGKYGKPGRFGSYALAGGIYQSLGVDYALSSTKGENGTLQNGTVECWIKTAKPTAMKVAVSHLNWYWLGVSVDGKATASYGHGTTAKTLNGSTALHGNNLETAPWHHLALVFANGAASLYVDGKLEDKNTAAAATIPDPDGGGFTVGGLRSVRTYDWWNSPGLIDEVRISKTPRYPVNAYPARPATLPPGSVLYIGPARPSDSEPFDQWIRTETA